MNKKANKQNIQKFYQIVTKYKAYKISVQSILRCSTTEHEAFPGVVDIPSVTPW